MGGVSHLSYKNRESLLIILKWIAYLVVGAIGLVVTGSFLTFILSASVVIGGVALVAFGVIFIAFCIKEYFKNPIDRDR